MSEIIIQPKQSVQFGLTGPQLRAKRAADRAARADGGDVDDDMLKNMLDDWENGKE